LAGVLVAFRLSLVSAQAVQNHVDRDRNSASDRNYLTNHQKYCDLGIVSMLSAVLTRIIRRLRSPGARAREHDPEKWTPVFGKDHAQSKS
jgi:hypothetical protein